MLYVICHMLYVICYKYGEFTVKFTEQESLLENVWLEYLLLDFTAHPTQEGYIDHAEGN